MTDKAKKSAGLPEFVPTLELRDRVATSAGAGMDHEQIAIALEISIDALERHFGHELTIGAYRKRMDVFEALHAEAKKGSASAAKLYLALVPQLAAPPAPAPKGDETPEKAQKAPVLGKKEKAQADATTAQVGTDWEALLPSSPTQ